jgi:hypothetical protein
MFSILKRNYIDVFCYTNNVNAYEYFPIRQAREFIPQWWKDIPNALYVDGCIHHTKGFVKPTIKRCPGIIEYYKKGLMIPLWSDVEIIVDQNINPEGWLTAAADHSFIESHSNLQKGDFLSSGDWFHNKLISPWTIETKEPLDFLYLQPHWNLNELNNDILIPNGYSSFYEGNHETNIQMFVNKSFDRVINIDAGTPILHLVPLTDKKIKIHTIYDEDRTSMLRKKGAQYSFVSKYYRKKKDPLHNNL